MAFNLHFIFLLLCLLTTLGSSINVNVMDYGAKGDGITDDSKAFIKAWEVGCGNRTNSIIYVPAGKKFLVKPVQFQGPCKARSIVVRVRGTMLAPNKRSDWGSSKDLLSFNSVNGLTFSGPGMIDGQGSEWWKKCFGTLLEQNRCARPHVVKMSQCTNLEIRRLHMVNGPSSFLSIDGCVNATISNINVTNPATSPNTDGIDLTRSTQIKILNSIFQTGDDCIAVTTGSRINISGITCGPGHGISIGSLGHNGESAAVEEVHVSNCTFQGTQNGARIKTWQGGKGYARKISFKHITLINAGNPIIIDQYYCPGSTCKNQTSAVKISGVSFVGFHGTSSTPDQAIQLSCSRSVACTNISIEHVHITSETPAKATCIDAHGRSIDTVPRISCLLP